jgi:hypothetical protein
MHPMDPTIALRPSEWMKAQNMANPMNPMSPNNPRNKQVSQETQPPAKAQPITYDGNSGSMEVTTIIVFIGILIVIGSLCMYKVATE